VNDVIISGISHHIKYQIIFLSWISYHTTIHTIPATHS